MAQIARYEDGTVSPEVKEIVNEIIGEPCTRKEVGSMRSLSLGFGEESAETKSRNRQYRKWELGTYSSDWKVLDGTNVVLAKTQSNNIGELDTKLGEICLGRLVSVQQVSQSTVRVTLDNGLAIEFTGDVEEEDEYFHVFGPGSRYLEFSEQGWRTGRSDTPWTA